MEPISDEAQERHNQAISDALSPLDIIVKDGIAKIETSRGTEVVDLTATRPDAAVKQLIRSASAIGYLAGQRNQRERTLQALGAAPINLDE